MKKLSVLTLNVTMKKRFWLVLLCLSVIKSNVSKKRGLSLFSSCSVSELMKLWVNRTDGQSVNQWPGMTNKVSCVVLMTGHLCESEAQFICSNTLLVKRFSVKFSNLFMQKSWKLLHFKYCIFKADAVYSAPCKGNVLNWFTNTNLKSVAYIYIQPLWLSSTSFPVSAQELLSHSIMLPPLVHVLVRSGLYVLK